MDDGRWTVEGACRLLIVLVLLAAGEAQAQVLPADTTQAAPTDTLAMPVLPDSLTAPTLAADTTQVVAVRPELPPLGFAGPEPGFVVLHDSIPARRVEVDAPGLLQDVPGAFLYDFGAFGWPDGAALFGLAPHRTTLLLDGLPFDDLVTGRARYDLLPLAWMEGLALGAGRLAHPVAVAGRMRAYDLVRPLTELRYMARADGLQSVMALHTQQRRRSLLGRPGVLQVQAGYGGHAADNAYEGSRLRRMRQLYARLRYRQPGWSVELRELHNRRYVGAQGGLTPSFGNPFDAVYTPGAVTPSDPNAERQTIRNDLALTLRAQPTTRLEPLRLTGFWTAETARYYGGDLPDEAPDTLGVEVDRLGLRAEAAAQRGPLRALLRAEAWRDETAPSLVFADSTVRADGVRERHAYLTGALDADGRLGRLRTSLTLGRAPHVPRVTGTARAETRLLGLDLFAGAQRAGQLVPLAARQGFGPTLLPADTARTGSVTSFTAGLGTRFGAFDLTATVFHHRLRDAYDYVATDADEEIVAVRFADTLATRSGVALELGLRRDAARGVYLTFQTQGLLPQDGLLGEALPALSARLVLGARASLFQGDLILDAAVRARGWTPFRTRTLHPPTGLLALREDLGSVPEHFGPNGIVDVLVEGVVRDATVFVAYENVLGNVLVVAPYPLSPRRLRLGIYWPILN